MTYRLFIAAAILNTAGIGAWSQVTSVDLRTQARNVDFSGAASTKTSKTGTALPATCSTGETFFKTDAPAGQNLYGCKPDNAWSLLSGGASSSLPAVDGATGKVLTYDGSALQWSALSGDVQGAPGSNNVKSLQGHPMSGTQPADGQVLTWNDSASQWQPLGVSVQAGTGINVTSNSISLEDAVVPLYYTGSGAPQIACAAGRDYYVDTAALNLYFCQAANTWQAVAKVGHTHAAADITSGTIALARGGTSSDLSTTGGTGQYLKQSSAGGAVSVGSIAATDLPSHTHAATDITSGKLALVRGGTSSDLSTTGGTGQYLKQSSAGGAVSVGSIAAADLPSHTHAAADITSGKLALVRGGTNQSTWTAGMCVQVNSAGTALESASAACGSGSGSGSATLPAVSGLGYFFPFGNGQEVTASAYNMTANKIAFFQFVSTPMSVDRLVYEAGTALSTSTSWNFAIYASDCSTLVASGSYSGTAASGVYVGVTLSPSTSLGLGVYYLMLAYPSSGSPTIYGWNSSSDIAKMGNTGSTTRVGLSNTAFSGTWPASGTNLCSGATTNPVNMPYMMLDFQ